MSQRLQVLLATTLILLTSCGPQAPDGTGGVSIEETFGKDGQSCGRGLAVVMSDYSSTNIALLDLQGETLSGSFISSGSTEVILNSPLSGDVVFPTGRMRDEVVLIDRYPNSVISFVEIASAEVRAQLAVRTGFDSNPHDYLELADGRAFVSRHERNANSGRESFDGGDDLLLLASSHESIVGRISLDEIREYPDERLRPSSLVAAPGVILVSLIGYDAQFVDASWARVVVYDIETESILFVHELEGLKNCGGLAISPDAKQIALSCSGLVDSANQAAPAHSGLAVLSLDLKNRELKEVHRTLAADLKRGPFSFSLDYASEEFLLVGTFGALEGDDANRPDTLLYFDLNSKEFDVLMHSKGEPFTLDGIQCMEACAICFVADAGRDLVHRFEVESSGPTGHSRHFLESQVNLPPRHLGWF